MVALKKFETGSGVSKIIAYGDSLSEAGIATFFHLLILLEVFPERLNKINFALIASF